MNGATAALPAFSLVVRRQSTRSWVTGLRHDIRRCDRLETVVGDVPLLETYRTAEA